ncbi:type IV pilus modification protein PilV [Noviherbaspirillum aerium]|uniref:type IV pilus modification protein PilV n=1 Tax=Noviherbaspirillum aerium TaxID=2588497 RepID=UPI00124EAA14|nr:type IV pilus modification protein PilV [Noviherbaspirillum aerium]
MPDTAAKGFSLIEVLVAIFVLALGVIGAAGMQLAALRSTTQSAFQSVAVQLAGELADKMRANAASAKLKTADNLYLGIDFQNVSESDSSLSKFCYADTCNSQELAQFDIHLWQRKLAAVLPGARALVCRDAEPWSASAQAFTWDCDSRGGTSSLVIKIGWQGKNMDGTLIRDDAKRSPPGVALVVEPTAP